MYDWPSTTDDVIKASSVSDSDVMAAAAAYVRAVDDFYFRLSGASVERSIVVDEVVRATASRVSRPIVNTVSRGTLSCSAGGQCCQRATANERCYVFISSATPPSRASLRHGQHLTSMIIWAPDGRRRLVRYLPNFSVLHTLIQFWRR